LVKSLTRATCFADPSSTPRCSDATLIEARCDVPQ
jgi:hypothetical protein